MARNGFISFMLGFTGAGLFNRVRRPGAPTEFIDSRTVEETWPAVNLRRPWRSSPKGSDSCTWRKVDPLHSGGMLSVSRMVRKITALGHGPGGLLYALSGIQMGYGYGPRQGRLSAVPSVAGTL